MKYRVRTDLAFEDEIMARGFWERVKKAREKAVVIRPSEPEEERPRSDIHKCQHDETPVKPCEIIEEFK